MAGVFEDLNNNNYYFKFSESWSKRWSRWTGLVAKNFETNFVDIRGQRFRPKKIENLSWSTWLFRLIEINNKYVIKYILKTVKDFSKLKSLLYMFLLFKKLIFLLYIKILGIININFYILGMKSILSTICSFSLIRYSKWWFFYCITYLANKFWMYNVNSKIDVLKLGK
jgi:hypothetical protein